jgi:D-arabinose 1-dehydrogenase-like Zn-dependent alcohol dehydrogenase
MPKMRAAQVTKANGALELVEREIPEPGLGEVRIKVEACGICHSDSLKAHRCAGDDRSLSAGARR